MQIMSFWLWKDCYKAADTNNVDKVTAIVNKYTDSYQHRKDYYNKIKHLV